MVAVGIVSDKIERFSQDHALNWELNRIGYHFPDRISPMLDQNIVGILARTLSPRGHAYAARLYSLATTIAKPSRYLRFAMLAVLVVVCPDNKLFDFGQPLLFAFKESKTLRTVRLRHHVLYSCRLNRHHVHLSLYPYRDIIGNIITPE